jgi:hypothetical protein
LQSKAEEYRARAAECARRAEAARDPEVHASYTEMARAWLRLASYVDEQNQKGQEKGQEKGQDGTPEM